tara:strand:- start:4990 stop:6345 length:1356 start_codon:yes stop_codon:yes gene_type:complete
MAIIIDPDDLNQGTEVIIDEAAKTIQLLVAGNLSNDGVTGQALYSFLKEEWKDDATLIPFGFPMEPITPEQFEYLDGWAPADTTSRNLHRNCGWAERNASGNIIAMYAGIISLGILGGSDQPYYDNDGTVTDFIFTGPINEAIRILHDPNGDGNYTDGYDYRAVLQLYAREQAKSYGSSDLAAIGVTAMTYQAYRFPLSNASDLKVTVSDATVDAYGVTITFHATSQSRTIGATSRDFGIIIDGNNKTAEEIYMAVQSALRKATDVDSDASTLIGQLAPELLVFVGDTLTTKFAANPEAGGGGVYIDNFQSNDVNRLSFQDNSNVTRTFPFVSSGNIYFNSNLQADSTSRFWMFFTTNPAGNFGSSTAVLVDDNSNADIAALISGATSISFDFDYDGNVQGGRSAATDADVTLVAIGTSGAKYVVATGTITRASGLSFTLTSGKERSYLNP